MHSTQRFWRRLAAVAVLACGLAAVSAAEPDTPAFAAAQHFKRGANFGDFLEVPPGQGWRVQHTAKDLALMKAEGFDHVRIPIGWHHYAGPAPDYRLSPVIFAKVDDLVTNALALHLSVLVNIHHFNEFTSRPAENTEKFYAIWRQIAAHYASAPAGLAFELINEPKDAATTELLNPVYAEVIRQIRQTNPRRTIFLGPGRWNSIGELPKLRLPADDQNLIVTVHCYEPFFFTHQGANWAGPEVQSLHGIVFPGPPDKPFVLPPDAKVSQGVRHWIDRYNTLPTEQNPSSPRAFRDLIQQAKVWGEQNHRPMHLGEFGAYTKADQASRARFYGAFRAALDEAGIGWAIWDWKSGFKYWDEAKGEPLPGMRQALFPRHE